MKKELLEQYRTNEESSKDECNDRYSLDSSKRIVHNVISISNDTILNKRKHMFKINLSNTRYDIIRKVVDDLKYWVEANPESEDWDVFWLDTSISEERFRKLKKFQKINHFIGMKGITRKDELSKNLKKMKKIFPQSYNFFPMTWILPNEISDFKNYYKQQKNPKTYIVKLKNSCQGKGIYLTKKMNNIKRYDSCVIQKYIRMPLLINGLKFDIRLYVLITGCDPLRIFLHEDGLVRFSIEKYKLPKTKNLKQINMHLTNFSINKNSEKFENSENPEDATLGHKRSWKVVFEKLKEEGLPMDSVMTKIEHLIIKTMCSIQPELKHCYNSAHISDYSNSMCFEILGFDILLDNKLKPWLLEVNHSPSFSVSSMVDERVKYAVIRDTLNILYMRSKYRLIHFQEYYNVQKFRRCYQDFLSNNKKELKELLTISRYNYENNHLGGYKRLYPVKNLLYYEDYIAYVSSIWDRSIGIPYSVKQDSLGFLFQDSVKKTSTKKEKMAITQEEHSENNDENVSDSKKLKYHESYPDIVNHPVVGSNCSTTC